MTILSCLLGKCFISAIFWLFKKYYLLGCFISMCFISDWSVKSQIILCPKQIPLNLRTNHFRPVIIRKFRANFQQHFSTVECTLFFKTEITSVLLGGLVDWGRGIKGVIFSLNLVFIKLYPSTLSSGSSNRSAASCTYILYCKYDQIESSFFSSKL